MKDYFIDKHQSKRSRWNLIEKHTTIKKHNFQRLLKLCVFESGFFLYQGKYYKQIKGFPIGNPLSGMVATFVLNDFLEKFYEQIPPKFITKYVDSKVK